MDVSQVSTGADKDLSAVEFGGGMIWEVAQVEVQQGDDAENRRCNTPESEDQGWTVTTSIPYISYPPFERFSVTLAQKPL